MLKTYPVDVGQVGHETPLGTYTISHAEWNPWWQPPASAWVRTSKPIPPGPDNPMGRVKLFFAPLYYLHGTPAEESLGCGGPRGRRPHCALDPFPEGRLGTSIEPQLGETVVNFRTRR